MRTIMNFQGVWNKPKSAQSPELFFSDLVFGFFFNNELFKGEKIWKKRKLTREIYKINLQKEYTPKIYMVR